MFFQEGFPKSLFLSYNQFSKKFSSPGMLHISTPQLYLFWSTLYKAKFWDFHSMIHDILNVQVWSQMGVKFVTSACNTQSIARLNEKMHKIINSCCHTGCFLTPPPLKSQNTKRIRVSWLGLAMWNFLAMRYQSASMREYAHFRITVVKKSQFLAYFW